MSGSLKVENGSSWLRDVERAFAGLELQSEEEVATLAATISKNMRDSAPTMAEEERARRLANPGDPVRKTSGRATIRYVRGHDREGFYVDVGPSRKAFYLAFQEYGTLHFPGRPFLRPSIERAVAGWGTSGSRR
ncbi:hypothetical protein KSP35_13055 [Aquihabitans sp. G128]|uniref:hypothetical protein n=1 Tax=Aquihabitans sp. G128 TaxID=2849779 RepID=UPI001C22EE0C|nr:hypothetical protein [Aquihabitans sp. G128]QXC59331.1 hypothetical protein KSP35_13055 [Aquihabitans sp. G128]